MKILYVYRTSRKKIFEGVKNNTEPDHQLYGANHLEKLGYQIEFSDIAYSPFNILHPIFYTLERLLISLTSIGFKLDQAILLLPKAFTSDLIITTTDSAGLPLLLLKKIGIVKKPIIHISTGLINELKNREKSFIFKIYKLFLETPELVVCHSIIEKQTLQSLIPKVEGRIRFIHFGIDRKYFRCRNKTIKYILSIGRDRSRDYKFLAQVAKKMKDQRFVIVTSKSNSQGINFPDNVKLYYDLPYNKVKDLYCESKTVFIPLKELERASGQISFLEALASGNKVVVSKVKGILEYTDAFKNNIYFFSPDDIHGAVSSLQRSVEAKFAVSNDFKFTSKLYAIELSKLIKNL